MSDDFLQYRQPHTVGPIINILSGTQNKTLLYKFKEIIKLTMMRQQVVLLEISMTFYWESYKYFLFKQLLYDIGLRYITQVSFYTKLINFTLIKTVHKYF